MRETLDELLAATEFEWTEDASRWEPNPFHETAAPEPGTADTNGADPAGGRGDAYGHLPEASAGEPFVGLSHAEVVKLEFDDAEADLIDGLTPRGVVVTTAGLPETYKGWVCTKKSVLIASGTGELFGCRALAKGPVGYFWQDDSTRNEAERVQLYAKVHETPTDLPLRWFLNEDLQLPRDLDRLRATIEHYRFIYVVLDSFYNVAAGVDLKDLAAGAIFAGLKTTVCDPTGCTVDVVDHMPWATDTNRKRLRGYGDVFKNAAVRAGLYIDADGTKLYVEARGNNIRGFKRTPAYWDADALELRLVDAGDRDETREKIAERALAWLTANPGWHATDAVRKEVKGEDALVREALLDLFENGQIALSVSVPGKPVQPVSGDPDADYRRKGLTRYWNASNQAESQSALPLTLTNADSSAQPLTEPESAQSASPRRGTHCDADSLAGSENEYPESDDDVPF